MSAGEQYFQEFFLIIWRELYKKYHYRVHFFRITNYQDFENNHVNLYEFLLLGK
jgi:hypothetical protein